MMSLIQWVNMMFAGFSDIQNLTGGIPWLSSGYDSVLSLPGPRFVLIVASGGHSPAAVHRLLVAVASLVTEPGL